MAIRFIFKKWFLWNFYLLIFAKNFETVNYAFQQNSDDERCLQKIKKTELMKKFGVEILKFWNEPESTRLSGTRGKTESSTDSTPKSKSSSSSSGTIDPERREYLIFHQKFTLSLVFHSSLKWAKETTRQRKS